MPERIPAERCPECKGFCRDWSVTGWENCQTCSGVGYVVPEAALDQARAKGRAERDERAREAMHQTPLNERPRVRDACRRRMPLDGADAQALEHALAITERERDAAHAEGVREGLEKAAQLGTRLARFLRKAEHAGSCPASYRDVDPCNCGLADDRTAAVACGWLKEKK